MTTTPSTGAPAPAAERLEWWERQQSRLQRRAAAPDAGPTRGADRGARLRAALSWIAAVYLAVVCLADDTLAAGAAAYLGVILLFLLWFVIARTHTISWRLAVAVFCGAAVWAAVIAAAAPVVLPQLAEASLLVLPMAALAVVAPGRVRRFAVSDWLLLGCALGLGNQATAVLLLTGAQQLGGPLSTATTIGPGPRSHYLLLALTGAATGVGIAVARHGARQGGRAALACRAGGVLLPLLAFGLVIGGQVARPDGWDLPLALRPLWVIATHGEVLVVILAVVVVAGLLIDTRRIRSTDDPGTDRIPYPYSPASAADRWTLAITGPGNAGPGSPFFYTLTAAVWAACCMVPYVVRDLLFTVGAHVRDPKEPLPQARSRGRAASVLTRVLRAESFGALDGPDGGRRIVRAGGIITLVLLTGLGVLLAQLSQASPHPWLGQWLGSARDALADAGHLHGPAGLPPVAEQTPLGAWGLALGVALLVALLVLTAGATGLALMDGGGRRLLLDRGRGSVSFTRTGPLGTRLSTSTVAELLLDGLTTLLTLIPATIVRPLAGSAIAGPARSVVAEFCADPARLIARRRRQLSAAPDDTGALMAVRTGSWDAASRRRWVDSRLATRAYRITSTDGRTSVPSEGLSLAPDGVAMVEATHLHPEGAPMLYEGQVPAVLAGRLLAPFDDEMRRYATVIRDPHNPVSRLRLIVASQPASDVLGGRAREILGHDLDLLIVVDPLGA